MKVISCVLFAALVGAALSVCPGSCSGHGTCNEYDECTCFNEGKSTYFGYLYDTAKGYNRIKQDAIRGLKETNANYGYTATLTTKQVNKFLSKGAYVQKQFMGPDCSKMTCPRGVSWVNNFRQNYEVLDYAAPANTALPSHSSCRHADFVECSDAGICDRGSGSCECFDGYEGAACQRTKCANECGGHGQCQSNIEFSKDGSLARATTGGTAATGYFGNTDDTDQIDPRKDYVGAWDSGIHFGCKCDTGFRGTDCSMQECPSSNDPLGWYGNNDGEDCSGRGLCDYGTGECACFSGYNGIDCSVVEALA